MKKNLFHNASLKLTIIYVSIMLTISLIFSIWLYRITLNEIQHSVRRIPGPIERLLINENSRFAEELQEAQEARIHEARKNLIVQFIVLNSIIAVSGGLGSYYLARRTLQPIEEAHDAQSRFAADASHELRTPIAAMRIENEIALTDPELTLKDAKKQLESTIEELDTLTFLTENLLTMARIGSEPLETKQTTIKKIINNAHEKVTSLAQQKSQKIIIKKVPDVFIQAHETLLADAFVTLLDNAIKYSPEKSTIKVETVKESRVVKVHIVDEGPGIQKDALPHIFKRFYRADHSRTKNDHQGFGLGLSIAKATVEAHGGTISVKNEASGGCRFTVQLPLS